ncbi:TLC domain-containing protein 2 isoform X2 [Macadamia integrifolia]|uniref:TLC domain-containing protein 2 isoform X2 n=1 Tax=Macadamia integrifolia TaxID=60698 RepID=UPI001C4F3FAA|nr:TLC domain-containing protein 2 isoform X2 [Macadamia integrifolia]
MARESHGKNTGAFFMATLVLWLLSVVFEIIFHKRTELAYVLVGCCFYQIANWVIRFSVFRDPLSVNTSVSLLHSSITSVSVIFILVNQWATKGLGTIFDHAQLFGGTWPGAYLALCFSCGYFAYDQWDMLQYRLYSGWIPSILVHHLILLVCFTLALYRRVTVNYLILTLICELHSIFLHVRKVRRIVGVRDKNSKVVRAEWALNWITFFVARVCSHILITVKLIRDASKFGKGVELPLALFGMAGMNLLNVFLGLDLFKAYRREKNQHPRHQE